MRGCVSGLQPFWFADGRYLGLRPRLLCCRAVGPGVRMLADVGVVLRLEAEAYGLQVGRSRDES